VDYWPDRPDEGRFHVLYQLFSMQHYTMLRLRTRLDNANPSMPTLADVYPNANWKEREMWDMFGIHFDCHPDPRRILMPYDWEGHPLRKDYPLGYEEIQFTFNYDEVAQRKAKAKGLR
jgi:NADH-quinone oxidoreductase subunit C